MDWKGYGNKVVDFGVIVKDYILLALDYLIRWMPTFVFLYMIYLLVKFLIS